MTDEPSFSTSMRSTASSGIELRSTNTRWASSASTAGATRRPLTSTSVALAPSPRSRCPPRSRPQAATEGRRDGPLAVGGQRLQIVGDGRLGRVVDVVATDDLHRRGPLGLGALDVRSRDLDALERLLGERRRHGQGRRGGKCRRRTRPGVASRAGAARTVASDGAVQAAGLATCSPSSSGGAMLASLPGPTPALRQTKLASSPYSARRRSSIC